MIVAMHQPNYIPWFGYFHKIYNCDLFVLVDTVLYSKRTVINRNKIRTQHGWKYLTVPVKGYDILNLKISEVEIDNKIDWGGEHYRSLEGCYKKAPYFNKYKSFFSKLYTRKWNSLVKLNEKIIYYIAKQFGIDEKKVIKSSNLNAQGSGMERIFNTCEELGADTYYSGIGAKNYQDKKRFEKEGIKLVYQKFEHPVYNQQFGEFIPNMSAVDLLFNCGHHRAREYLIR